MANGDVGSTEKKRINSINFLQSQIAKYYGNDGILSSKEKEELDKLSVTLEVDPDQYRRLKKIAKDEIRNFKKFDVVSYLLDREDKLKLYSDAERLSIRISRVERWVAELEGIITPKEDDTTNKSEILIDKMKKIMKWFDQELFVETNEEVDSSKDVSGRKADEKSVTLESGLSESEDEKYKVDEERVANEICDFINEESNLAWRSYCKYLLMEEIKKPGSVELSQNLRSVLDAVNVYLEIQKTKTEIDKVEQEIKNIRRPKEELEDDDQEGAKPEDKRKRKAKKHLSAETLQYKDLDEIFVKKIDSLPKEKRDALKKKELILEKKELISKNEYSFSSRIANFFGKEKKQGEDKDLEFKKGIDASKLKEKFASDDKTIKAVFDSAVREYATNEKNGVILGVEPQRAEHVRKELDEIKMRLRQYSDMKKLFRKRGYKESKTEVDFEKHLGALIVYVLVLGVSFFAINTIFFQNLDIIHRFVEGEDKIPDPRDNKKYTAVMINGVQWMAENLNYALDSSIVSGLPKYGGRFYKWDMAADSVCPSGWRLPTVQEWQGLIEYFGDDSLAALNLKSRTLWKSMVGSDSAGFSAVPAGYYNAYNGGNIIGQYGSASWWTYTMKSDKEIYVVKMDTIKSEMQIYPERVGYNYHSVRCVKMDGKKIQYASKPKLDRPQWQKKMKGTIVDFKNGTDLLPIVRFSDGKTQPLYDSALYVSLLNKDSYTSSFVVSPEKSENAKKDRQLIFPKDARIDITRYFEGVYSKKDGAWVKDSVWSGDTVKVSGKVRVNQLEEGRDPQCKVGIRFFVGTDSTDANVAWSQPCDSLQISAEYMAEVSYKIFRQCNSADCEENSPLMYRFVKADIHAQ